MSEWRAVLNGVGVGSAVFGDLACLTVPPDGLGVPDLRTEDTTYPQRDGVEHFSDWYAARLITLTALLGGDCGCSGDTRANARTLANAWGRQCADTELVLWTPCNTPTTSWSDDFEGTLNWNTLTSENTVSLSTDHARSPTHSLKVTRTAGGTGLMFSSQIVSYSVPIIEGQQGSATAWVRADNTGRGAVLRLNFLDASNASLSTISGTPVFDAFGKWTRITVSGDAPPNAVKFNIRVAWQSTPVGESHYVDDVSAFSGDGDATREVNGPFGVRGRPRVATKSWRQGKNNIADVTLRFDADDERLYILDPDGTPGSGAVCATLNDPPGTGLDSYSSAVISADSEIRCLWPMDFLRTDSWDPFTADGLEVTHDIIGTDNAATMWGGFGSGHNFPPTVGPAIDYSIGLSSIVGPANLQTPAFASSYTQGLFGWWQVTPSGDLPSGAMFSFGNASIGQDSVGQPSPSIRWAGTNVAMNSATQDAFGFTPTLRDQPVLIVVTWTATTLRIYGGYQGNLGGTKLLQTVTVTALPTPSGSAILLQIFGRASTAMMGDGTFDGEAITTTLADVALSNSPTELILPDVGDLCSPIQVTFDIPANGTFEDIYIFREDGSYVGVLQDGPYAGNNASSLDTDSGTAKRFFGQEDATAQIAGDPFLQVSPGETLNIFAGSPAGTSVTVCYRPSVLSA